MLFLLATLTLLVPALAGATPERFGVWSETYPGSTLGSRLSCLICHTSTFPTPAWNPYGTSIREHPTGPAVATLASVLADIEPQDADDDGFTNIEEINANSAPGDAAEQPSSAPAKVGSPNPANNATGQPLDAALSWGAADGADSYDVHFGEGTTAGDLVFQGNQTARTFAPEGLTAGTRYVWRIDAVAGEETTQGDLWSFTTAGSSAPAKVGSPDPANNATGQPLDATLSWGAAEGAESYDVHFGEGTSAGDLELQGNQTALSFTPEGLTAGTDYVWRVDSVAGDLTTEGDLWTFTTEAAAQRPRIDNPFPEPLTTGSAVVELEPLVSGLASPLGVVPAGDGSGRLFVYDQAGVVIVVQADRVTTGVFLDVRGRMLTLNPGYDERGLLGFTPAPDFAESGKCYAYISEPVNGPADFSTVPALEAYNHQSAVVEWTVSAEDENVVDPESARELLRIDQPQFNHNGGTLMFGPDGYLYITLGDGGAADDQGDGHSEGGNGQDLGNVLGTVLRIDPDGSNSANGAYGIPGDNPFVGQDGLDEIFVYGLRNVFRFSFQPQTGNLILADVGQNHIEEISIAQSGDNCGWPIMEGTFYFENNGSDPGYPTNEPPAGGAPAGLLDPVAQYDHDEGLSVMGGFVYAGSHPDLQGLYVFGDFGKSWVSPSGRLFTANLATGQVDELVIGEDARPLGLWVKGMGIDADGEVYVCGSTTLGPTGSNGVVLRITTLAGPTAAGTWMLY